MQARDLRLQLLEHALALEEVERREAGGAGQRIPRVRVAVKECELLLIFAEEGRVDLLGRQGRGERQIAAGDALGEAQEIGRDRLLLAREHRPGAAEAGRDLVADEEHVVLGAELARGAQEAGRLQQHAGGALHQRLDDERGELVRRARRACCSSASIVGAHAQHVEEQRMEDLVEEIDAADADRADGVAVIGVGEREELLLLGAAALLLILEGDLERDLDGGRARVGVEDARSGRAARSATSRSASSIDGTLARPSSVEWATRSSCARTASSSSRRWWPWTLTHSELTPSR